MVDWFPIQVTQKDKVARPDIDSFEAVMAREERECAAFHKKTRRIIKLITVQEIVDELYVQKM